MLALLRSPKNFAIVQKFFAFPEKRCNRSQKTLRFLIKLLCFLRDVVFTFAYPKKIRFLIKILRTLRNYAFVRIVLRSLRKIAFAGKTFTFPEKLFVFVFKLLHSTRVSPKNSAFRSLAKLLRFPKNVFRLFKMFAFPQENVHFQSNLAFAHKTFTFQRSFAFTCKPFVWKHLSISWYIHLQNFCFHQDNLHSQKFYEWMQSFSEEHKLLQTQKHWIFFPHLSHVFPIIVSLYGVCFNEVIRYKSGEKWCHR